MNKIEIFKNDQFGEIRTALIDNQPYFVARDIATALGYAVPQKAVQTHCRHCSKIEHWSNKGTTVLVIPESDIYRLVMKSKLPNAELFQDWVCEEILPSIRKHGGYLTSAKIEEILLNPDTIITLARSLKEEQKKREILEQKCVDDAPKVLFANAVESSSQSCLIGELAKILRQNGIMIGQNRLFEWLRSNEYLCSRGESYNLPTQRYMELGLFEIKKTSNVNPDGSVRNNRTTKVTGKGQIYFVEKLLANKQKAELEK